MSERLELVHAGLDEMKALASSVGHLKKVMTNSRTYGTWVEVQLGSNIESLFTADQFQRNLNTGGNNSNETKYIRQPQTSDFAIMFLPTEGLIADAMRFPGLQEQLTTQLHVILTGSTMLSAVLSSVRLGFRTLAIEKRTSEVWKVLGAAKAELRKFGEVVGATKRTIDHAANTFDELGRRTRAIERNLNEVYELPGPGALAAAALELCSGRPPAEGQEAAAV